MKIRFNAAGARRKALVRAVSEITGAASRYLGVPSLCYEVDHFTIDRKGTLIFDDRADSDEIENLLNALEERGFIAENAQDAVVAEETTGQEQEIAMPGKDAAAPACENVSAGETEGTGVDAAIPPADGDPVGLTISLPLAGFDENALQNLRTLVDSKAGLIRKALGVNALPIETEEGRVSFPWFTITPDASDAEAYRNFVSALCRAAKTQKRVTAKEREVTNEKYVFRCFLLRLGFIGKEYKETRKVLLRNLSGNGAFRDGRKKEADGHEVSE